jgi:flagellar biosynthetic protein FliP
MVSAFVRIQIVLSLIRQALGSPQIPGNQVISALALLLTLIVMAPIGKRVYERAIEPLAAGRIDTQTAWDEASHPFKSFMIAQIARTKHEHYVWEIHDLGQSLDHAQAAESTAEPTELEQFPLHVIAAAFLISELTTAIFIGFAIYLPFLVIDLVVSAILSAMGLFLLPPTLVALPVKLILFALADGWMLTAGMLLRSFAAA